MDIMQALPPKKYAAAAKHSTTPEFAKKRDETIWLLQQWEKAPVVNHNFPMALWFSYGKDSSAVAVLLKMAGVDFATLTIDNGGDFPFHYSFYDEWDKWFGTPSNYKEKIIYKTEYRYVEHVYDAILWGRRNGLTKKDGSPIDYFDLGQMIDVVVWNVSSQFDNQWATNVEDVLQIWADRGSEAMYKFFQMKRDGVLSRWGMGKNQVPYYKGEPIGWWKEIDVWALLVSVNAPISPIYSMHQIAQRPGKAAFPQTLWYPCADHLSSTFYNWMARYAPQQLKELLEFFPEIPTTLRRKNKEKKAS